MIRFENAGRRLGVIEVKGSWAILENLENAEYLVVFGLSNKYGEWHWENGYYDHSRMSAKELFDKKVGNPT